MTEEEWRVTTALSARMADQDGEATLYLEGEFDLDGAGSVEQQLLRALETHSRVVVDLSALTFMDSSGIAVLVRTKDAADERDAQLVLRLGQAAAVRRVLDLVGLDEVLGVRD